MIRKLPEFNMLAHQYEGYEAVFVGKGDAGGHFTTFSSRELFGWFNDADNATIMARWKMEEANAL